MPLAVALLVAVLCASCATTYEGARDRAAIGGVAFGAGLSTWVAGIAANSEPVAVSGVAVATAGMVFIVTGGLGMTRLPRRVVLALQLARELIEAAKLGRCATVIERMHDVESLDFVVYEVVLVQDEAVSTCLATSS